MGREGKLDCLHWIERTDPVKERAASECSSNVYTKWGGDHWAVYIMYQSSYSSARPQMNIPFRWLINHSFIHSFIYLLRTYYVVSHIRGTKNIMVNKNTFKNSWLYEAYILKGETDDKQ